MAGEPSQIEVTVGSPTASFEWAAYRALMDRVTGSSRRAGLLDRASAEAAVADPVTVLLQGVDVDSAVVPLLVPVGHIAGWDAARCDRLAQVAVGRSAQAIWLSQVPLEPVPKLLSEAFDLLASTHPDPVVFAEGPDALLHALTTVLNPQRWRRVELLDPGWEPPSISLWEGTATPAEISNGEPAVGADLVEKICHAVSTAPETGVEGDVELVPGDRLADDVVEELWQLYVDRFQWLGEAHPISMEDDRKSFEFLLQDSSTLVGIYRVDRVPACWTWFLADSVRRCSWLSSDGSSTAMPPTLFFPGIVARADGIGHYAEPLLRAVADAIAAAASPYRIVFEATNRSEAYVPGLIENYVNRSSRMSISAFTCVERTSYAAWSRHR